MVLHLIQRSPFSSTALSDCLNIIASEDSILFMQDGVYTLTHPSLKNINNSCNWLQDDLNARGLSSTAIENPLSYSEFVNLCANHEKVISWF